MSPLLTAGATASAITNSMCLSFSALGGFISLVFVGSVRVSIAWTGECFYERTVNYDRRDVVAQFRIGAQFLYHDIPHSFCVYRLGDAERSLLGFGCPRTSRAASCPSITPWM